MELMIIEHFTNADGKTPLYVAQQNILPGYCGWPMSRDLPFKHNLDHYIMAFHGVSTISCTYNWSAMISKYVKKIIIVGCCFIYDYGNSLEVIETLLQAKI